MARWQNRKRQNKRGLTWPGALRDIYQGENKGQKLSYMSGLKTLNPRTFLWFRWSIFCVPKIRPEGRSTKNLDWLGGKHKVVFIAILSVLGDYTGSPMGAEQSQKLWNQWGSWAAPKTQASFLFAKVLRECRGNSAEEFCFDGRSGLPTLYFCYDISSFAKTIV